MPKRFTRREALEALGAAGAVLSAACGRDAVSSASELQTSVSTGATTAGACAVSPDETRGPFTSLARLIRSDIREGRRGAPVVLTLTVVDTSNNCHPVPDAVVDIWQCDAEGHYSQYDQPHFNGTSETFLRGIQTTNAKGQATFTTIYPGWYEGRATHIHVEVSVNGRSMKVTQIAFPERVTAEVYATGLYAPRGQNPTSNRGDGVFRDSVASELASITGDPTRGYIAGFTVGISS